MQRNILYDTKNAFFVHYHIKHANLLPLFKLVVYQWFLAVEHTTREQKKTGPFDQARGSHTADW